MHEVLKDLVHEAVRSALEDKGLKGIRPPPGALRADQAAAYIGVGRSRFYKLLTEDSQLKSLSFTVGNCRMWAVPSLDAWMRERSETEKGCPKECGAAPSGGPPCPELD